MTVPRLILLAPTRLSWKSIGTSRTTSLPRTIISRPILYPFGCSVSPCGSKRRSIAKKPESGSEHTTNGRASAVASREPHARILLQSESMRPTSTYRLPRVNSAPASNPAKRSGMRSGGCERSASMTTTRSKRASRMPNSTERERSRGGCLRTCRRTGRLDEISRTISSVPSCESSSTINSSQSEPPRSAVSTRFAKATRLPASRKVGATTETGSAAEEKSEAFTTCLYPTA